MAFNFTDDLGFDETAASPNDVLTIRTIDAGNIQASRGVKFTDLGVYVQTVSDGAYGTATVFVPWSYIKYIAQNN